MLELFHKYDLFKRTSIVRGLMALQMLSLFWSFKLFIIITIALIIFLLPDISFNNLKKLNKIYLILIGLYFLYVLSMLWTDNKKSGWADLETKFSLLFFPLFFSLFDLKQYVLVIVRSFVWSAFFSSLMLVLISVYHFLFKGDFLLYTDFSFFLHPAYFSMYIASAAVFLITNKNLFSNKIIWVMLFVFSISIVFSASKAGIVIYLLMLIAYSFIFHSLLKNMIFIIFIVGSIGLFYNMGKNYFTPLFDRFITTKEILNEIFNNDKKVRIETNSIRYYAWKNSLRVIRDNWLIGTGAGDVHAELNRLYEKENLNILSEKNINAHNQFLNTFIATGIMGFILLCSLFVTLFLLAIQNKNPLIFFIALIVMINLMVESMLETQAGTIFISYILCLLLLLPIKNKNYDI